MGSLLDSIHGPADLQALDAEQLRALCAEIRGRIIDTVAHNGGHLASNLGTVELTVALYRVFASRDDSIVWDVGHQAYTHKMLTGRADRIGSIRTQGGLSGFPNRSESSWDAFTVGHSSTSISAALGIAQGKMLRGAQGHTIAVIGDGALTGGLAYEGLNNAGRFRGNLIVVLNDNKMSISRNVGAIARYLAHMRAKPGYLKAKSGVEGALQRTPLIGRRLADFLKRGKDALRAILYNSTLFEDMGLLYYGPFDGHNLSLLTEVLHTAATIDRPVLLHVVTEKGRGYSFAEQNPGSFHGVSGFDVATGKPASCGGATFSAVAGESLCGFAQEDSRVCAITAAMKTGTGLRAFEEHFPKRFFDVGIAEEHAITFAGGLSVSGMLPVFAVYSTFLQRGYDQIIHDAALQRTKIVLAVDRAGVVGQDGETHQGIFDAAFLQTIPGVTVYAPCYFEELHADLHRALYERPGVVAVRYPRGEQPFRPGQFVPTGGGFDRWGKAAAPVALVTYGRLFAQALRAQAMAAQAGVQVEIVKLDQIVPVPRAALDAVMQKRQLFFFEEGVQRGGIGEHFISLLQEAGFAGRCVLRGIRDFVPHATVEQCLHNVKLDAAGMWQLIEAEWKQ